MQSLKSIRLAEVANFFKQSFEQKKTDSTVLRLQGDHHCACAQKWCHFSFFSKNFKKNKGSTTKDD